jgi:hypothetical protein
MPEPDMSSLQGILPAVRLRHALHVMTLAAAVCATTGAAAAVIKVDDMLRGITSTRPQCALQPQAVWVSADGQDFCVRYYISIVGGQGPRPVVFLDGDRLEEINMRTWQWIAPAKDHVPGPEMKDVDTDDLVRIADGFSRSAKTTAIYLARIGVDGTSGSHLARRTELELHVLNAALDAIKQRHGFEGFHLAGQSGGSRLLGGLVAIRHDIGCAISGSGALAWNFRTGFSDPGRVYFDILQSVPLIAKNSALRLIMVTDPKDKVVPLNQKTEFVERMRQAGRPVSQFLVETTDDNHHSVDDYTRLVMAGCILGKSDGDIGTAVTTLVKRNADYNARKRAEAALTSGAR